MDDDQPSIRSPMVDARLDEMNGLQRATESFRYIVLSIEHWISPGGRLRDWLRRNVHVGVCLLIPAIFVMPIVGLILWQLAFWMSMFTGIVARLIFLIFVSFVIIKAIKR